MSSGFDVFVSYAHADRERACELRDALVRQGVSVWMDDGEIEVFASISSAIEDGLRRSKALVVYYSSAYPASSPCQWELTVGFLAAQRGGADPRRRVLVVNPEPDARHVQPVQLRDARAAPSPAPGDGEAHDALARRIASHVATLDGELAELGRSVRRRWFGQRPVQAARFVGRATDMWRVHSALTGEEVGLIADVRGDPTVQLTGIGGIGKSLLAAEYALRFGAAYPGGTFWLRAHGHDDAGGALSDGARDALRDTQLLAVADALGLDTRELSAARLPAALGRELDERAQPFLWVVDDLPGRLGHAALERWLAPGSCGRTLVTTRGRDYAASGAHIELGELGEDDGVSLLALHRPPDGPDELAAARRLVADLGGHALALDVAGAALATQAGERPYAAYRDDLADLDRDALELAARFAGLLPGGHEPSIAATIVRSIERLGEDGRDFLRLAAAVPGEPIGAGLVSGALATADGLDDDAAAARAAEGARDAMALSLAEPAGEREAWQVHALVCRTVRLLERASPRLAALTGAATTQLTRTLRELASQRRLADGTLLAQARRLASPPRDASHAALLSAVAAHDHARGDHASARAHLEEVLGLRRQLFGDDDEVTLEVMHNLAVELSHTGDPDGARELEEEVLARCRRVLGEQHLGTLKAMGNLAWSLHRDGETARAQSLLADVLAGRRDRLGADDPDTLMTLSAIARMRGDSGDLAGARELGEQALARLRHVLGPEHPDSLIAMVHLASTLTALDDLPAARALYDEVLAGRRWALGDDHPDTLYAMRSLARALEAEGDLAGARAAFEALADAAWQVDATEHRDALAALGNLALRLGDAGDHDAARAVQERVATASRRAFGDEHRKTLVALANLAATLHAQGELAGARRLKEQVLQARRRVLGADDPETLQSMNNLAVTLTVQGELPAARRLLESVIERRERVLGEDHAYTVQSLANLAGALQAQGDAAGERALLEEVVRRRRRALGEAHADTLHAMYRLAHVLYELGDQAGAVALAERIVAVRGDGA